MRLAHDAGVLHRDIRRQNIIKMQLPLLHFQQEFSAQLPAACRHPWQLVDFGLGWAVGADMEAQHSVVAQHPLPSLALLQLSQPDSGADSATVASEAPPINMQCPHPLPPPIASGGALSRPSLALVGLTVLNRGYAQYEFAGYAVEEAGRRLRPDQPSFEYNWTVADDYEMLLKWGAAHSHT